MATIGIICDTYKLEMFKEALDDAGIAHEIDEKSTSKFKAHTVIRCMNTEQSIIGPITTKIHAYWDKHFAEKRAAKNDNGCASN